MNPNTDKYYQDTDFKIGEIVLVNAHKFLLWEADEFTYSYMEQNSNRFPESSVGNIIEKIRRRLGYYGDRDEYNRVIFEIIDGSGDTCD